MECLSHGLEIAESMEGANDDMQRGEGKTIIKHFLKEVESSGSNFMKALDQSPTYLWVIKPFTLPKRLFQTTLFMYDLHLTYIDIFYYIAAITTQQWSPGVTFYNDHNVNRILTLIVHTVYESIEIVFQLVLLVTLQSVHRYFIANHVRVYDYNMCLLCGL